MSTKFPTEAAIAQHYAGGTRVGKVHRNGTNHAVTAKRNRQHLVAACGRRVDWALGVADFDPLTWPDDTYCGSCYPVDHFRAAARTATESLTTKTIEAAILARLEAKSDHSYQWPRWAAAYEAAQAVADLLATATPTTEETA